MKRKFVFILSLSVFLASLLYVGFNAVEVEASESVDASKVYGVEMLWNNSMGAHDFAVSKDGNYLVAVNDTGIYYFSSNNSDPKWWYYSFGQLLSVAISASGESVVVGDEGGVIIYFNSSTTRSGQITEATWMSEGLGGGIERGTLDMSDDGEYVAVGGTGINLSYFSGCMGRSSLAEEPTWTGYLPWAWDVAAVDMSSDGKYLAAGGTNESSTGYVVFYKNANMAPYPTEPHWRSNLIYSVQDLVLSDDGYAVAAVDDCEALYYWANATTLSGMLWPDATWTNPGIFWRVDMSDYGNDIVAASSVHFWANARERQGNQTEDWVKLESVGAWDVAISENGGIIAAATGAGTHFFKSDGSIIGKCDLPQCCFFVSMSGNGRIVAVGGYVNYGLYVFRMIVDSTSPVIENVYQQPANDSVHPDDEVMVYANVTDDQSGLKQVTLNYTNGNGTWIAVNMTNLEGNVWNGTIPSFDYCTYVNYTIVAEDEVGNIITTEEVLGYQSQYHVIPEFPTWTSMLLVFALLTVTIAIYKRKLTKTLL